MIQQDMSLRLRMCVIVMVHAAVSEFTFRTSKCGVSGVST